MTNRHYSLISLIIVAVISIISCGGGGGTPGSSGTDRTGISIDSAVLFRDAQLIDTYRCPDCCGTAPNLTSEQPLTDIEVATLTIDASNATPTITTMQFPAVIQHCDITYLKVNEDPAAPIIDQLRIYPACVIVEGTSLCDVEIIDGTRKRQHADAVFVNGTNIPATQPTKYIIDMQCIYETNNTHEQGTFPARMTITLGQIPNC